MRIAILLLLGVLLATTSGCVTLFAYGSLDAYEPDDYYAAPSAAWIVPAAAPGGDEVLIVRTEEHWRDVAPQFIFGGCPSRERPSPAILRYRLDADGDTLEIASIEYDAANFAPPPGARRFAVHAPDGQDETDALVLPATLVRHGQPRTLSFVRSTTSVPARAGKCVLVPIAVATDVALVPVYAVGIVSLLGFSAVHDLAR